MSNDVRRYTKTMQNIARLRLINWNNNSKHVFYETLYFAKPQKIHRQHDVFASLEEAKDHFLAQPGNMYEHIEVEVEDQAVIVGPIDVEVIGE